MDSSTKSVELSFLRRREKMAPRILKNIEKIFHGLLGLDEWWEVRGVDYDSETETFFMAITETDKLWEKKPCQHQSFKSTGTTFYAHSETRSWQHICI